MTETFPDLHAKVLPKFAQVLVFTISTTIYLRKIPEPWTNKPYQELGEMNSPTCSCLSLLPQDTILCQISPDSNLAVGKFINTHRQADTQTLPATIQFTS